MRRVTLLLVALLPAFAAVAARAQTPLTTAFTYQGELASSGTPATGTHDIRFRLFDAASGGNQIGSTLCSDDLAVTAGRFAASLDFGAAAFAGKKRFWRSRFGRTQGWIARMPPVMRCYRRGRS
jgi:hypothetical protein